VTDIYRIGKGDKFSDQTDPQVVVQVGEESSEGIMEISDIIFSTVGPTAGAIVVEWNVKESFQGAAGMWDSTIRYIRASSAFRSLAEPIIRHTDWVVRTVPTSSPLNARPGQFPQSAWLHSLLCTSPVHQRLTSRFVPGFALQDFTFFICNTAGNLGLVS
jgi:hypothetical protein